MGKTPIFALAAAFALSLTAMEAASAPSGPAHVKVFSGGAMTDTVKQIGANYQRSSGNTFEVVSDTTGALLNKLKAGEKADVIVVTSTAMDQLEKEGALVAGSRKDLVTALIGVAIKPGARKPDLATADAFKASLLQMRSVSYVNPKAGGTSGTHFEGLLAKMGIAEQMKAKTVYRNQGSEVADAVAKGEAEIGVSFIAELAPNKGIAIAGPLPASLQLPTKYSAAVLKGTPNLAAAQGAVAEFTSRAGMGIFKAAGLEPIPQ